MKRIKCELKLALIILWLAVSLVAAPSRATDDIRLDVIADRDTFLVGEPIWNDMSVTNLGEEQAAVKPLTPTSDWFRFVVIDAQDDTLEPQGKEDVEWVGGGPTFTLLPGDTLYICRNLLEATGPGTLERFVPGRTYLDPGTYRVNAVYDHGIYSNEISLTVLEPQGAERTALDLWREGYRKRKQGLVEQALTKWQELLTEHPESKYAPSACWALATTYEVFRKQLTSSALYEKKLLSDYPNSGFCQYAFGVFTSDKDQEQREQILRQLEAELAGTRAGKFAKNLRKKVYAY